MKKQFALSIIGWLLASLGGYKTMAQTDAAPEKKETQEIIIRKKSDKDTKVTVEITGDKVLINGKPLAEFNEDGLTINKRKVIVRDGNKIMMDFDGRMMDLDGKFDELKDLQNLKSFNFNFNNDGDDMNVSDGREYTYLGVTSLKSEEGVVLSSVAANSPADKAGLLKGDIIYKIDDEKITEGNQLTSTIRGKKSGEKVKIYYLRDGKKKDAKVVLGTQKSSSRSFSFSKPDGSVKSFSIPRSPATPRIYNDNIPFDGNDFEIFNRRQKLGLKIRDTEEGNGVTVLEVEASSAAAAAGLMKDDVITEIGGAKVNTTDEAREELQSNREKSNYSLKAKRNGTEMNFMIKIPKNLKTATL